MRGALSVQWRLKRVMIVIDFDFPSEFPLRSPNFSRNTTI